MRKVIENEHIYLRKMESKDTDHIIKWRNSSAVRENFIYQELFTRETHENWIRTMIETDKADQLIICVKLPDGKGKPVGSVYIRDIDKKHNKAEYGIFIGEEFARGCGIGSMAASLMIDYCFKQRKLHRLFLRVFADNPQAIRSYEKAGFVKEAYLKDDVLINGRYRDIVLMGIINPEDKECVW